MVSFAICFLFVIMWIIANGNIEMFAGGLCAIGNYDIIYHDISYKDCVEKCRTKKACVGVSVKSMANICRLHTTVETLTVQHPCPGYVFTEKTNWNERTSTVCETDICDEQETCSADEGQCVYQECLPIEHVLYGTIFGSENRKVGSKALYRCNKLVNDAIVYVTRTCQSNGTWSDTIPSCPLPEFILPPYSGHPTYQQFDMFANGVSFVYDDTILFKVMARNDVHILLQIYRNTFEYSYVIELVIGGWGNSKSVLRQGINGGLYHSQHSERNIINGASYSSFWITSTSSCILVGKGTDPMADIILQYCGVIAQHQYLSLGVGYGSGAHYLFP